MDVRKASEIDFSATMRHLKTADRTIFVAIWREARMVGVAYCGRRG